MRRALALPLAAALLATAPAARAAEPLDLDLYRLGAPRQETWAAYGAADPAAAAMDARRRFAALSAQTALAFTSALLDSASTTGYSGFDFGFESAYVGVDPRAIGADQAITTAAGAATFPATGPWVTKSLVPYELYVPSFHVRKALPFSLEAGGRILYLSQSSYGAATLEGKWALNEGFLYVPDLAVRVAHTIVFGQKDLNLGATSVDLVVSKRFGVNGVVGLTPYGAARFLFVRASTDGMYWGENAPVADPRADPDLYGGFPAMSAVLYRTTVGVRMQAYAVSIAAEGTYFGGANVGSSTGAYPKQKLRSSWASAVRLGFEF